jgi:hypothetical protein
MLNNHVIRKVMSQIFGINLQFRIIKNNLTPGILVLTIQGCEVQFQGEQVQTLDIKSGGGESLEPIPILCIAWHILKNTTDIKYTTTLLMKLRGWSFLLLQMRSNFGGSCVALQNAVRRPAE